MEGRVLTSKQYRAVGSVVEQPSGVIILETWEMTMAHIGVQKGV